MNIDNLFEKCRQAYAHKVIHNLCKAEVEYLSAHYMNGKKPSCTHCASSLVNYASQAYLNWSKAKDEAERKQEETPNKKSVTKKKKK